jgi:hypothetical protein
MGGFPYNSTAYDVKDDSSVSVVVPLQNVAKEN